MSRVKRFAHSLVSGYALLGANVIYTLTSVPIALHYLSKEEFGLWALVSQFAGYFLLLDLGMSGSVSRILIDHKDDRGSTGYGAVIQTGFLVQLTQGLLMALGGMGLSYWLPGWVGVPQEYWHIFRVLVAWQCGVQAFTFVGRMFGHILQAHQRYDINNYGQVVALIVSLAGLWLGFQRGLGLYSVLVGAALGGVASVGMCAVVTMQLHMFPSRGQWGRPSWTIFRELFAFGRDLFLLAIGLQLNSASQVIILSRTLGLETAAVWSIATKPFALGVQFVSRIFDFSGGALSEMFVRGERDQLRRRFRDVVILTASVSVLAGAALAVCNGPFIQVWTAGRIVWDPWNDVLLAWLLVATCVTRCHIGLLGQTKEIGGMRFIYLFEGICFVLAGFLIAPYWGTRGLIATAIVCNLMWSGTYGVRRTARYFGTTTHAVALQWLATPRNYLFLAVPLAALCRVATRSLPIIPQLAVSSAAVGLVGLALLWSFGLTGELRHEVLSVLARARARLRFAARP